MTVQIYIPSNNIDDLLKYLEYLETLNFSANDNDRPVGFAYYTEKMMIKCIVVNVSISVYKRLITQE